MLRGRISCFVGMHRSGPSPSGFLSRRTTETEASSMSMHEEHEHEGNCCHSYEHTHEHTHTHTHADGTTHTHGHSHVHAHEHVHPHEHFGDHGEHDHSHGDATTSERTVVLLDYMLNHNRDHAAEIHEMAHQLEAEGKTEEARLLHLGVSSFNEGNNRLEEALALLKGPTV